VRARYTIGDGSDLERIGRQQAFMSSLISQVQAKMLDPLAIYRFLDAATRSLTIDSQLGGITGLYNLGESLRGIPKQDIAFFTLPNVPRGDGANVLWAQPQDNAIFASFRGDVPASDSLFAAVAGGGSSSLAAGVHGAAQAVGARTGSAKRYPAAPGSAAPRTGASPSATVSNVTSTGASPAATSGATPGSTPGPGTPLQARTANQSICAG
jgi:hypothetical protein